MDFLDFLGFFDFFGWDLKNQKKPRKFLDF